MPKAKVKRSIDRLRLVAMSITITYKGDLDFDAVTDKLWYA